MSTPSLDHPARTLGAYLPLNGGIEFFGLSATLLKPTDALVDLGARRGAWFYDDRSEDCRRLRDFKSAVGRVIGLDMDPVVLDHPTTTGKPLFPDNKLLLADASIAVIGSEHVRGHIEGIATFVGEIDRVLEPRGFAFARTTHKYHCVCIAARLARSANHVARLLRARLHRKDEDVFPSADRWVGSAGIRH